MAHANCLVPVIVVAIASQLVFHCEGYTRGQTAWQGPSLLPRSGTPRDGGAQETPFNVITGWIDDSSDESSESATSEPRAPWRHHVDFDEMHPGEDQIAEESTPPVSFQSPNLHSLFRQFQLPNIPLPVPRPARASVEEVTEPRLVVPVPSFNVDPDREFAHPFLNVHSLWSMLGQGAPKLPWYKGSNVCIKREEEDEMLEADSTPENSTPTASVNEDDDVIQFPKDEPFMGAEETANANESEINPWNMKLSYCQEMDTRRVCEMKLLGDTKKRTIRVTYECCHGYSLDEKKELCSRRTYKDVAKTMEDVGGNEFLALIKGNGLLRKLTSEDSTLSIFVPTNEAVSNYLTSHEIDSNAIDFIIGPEAVRRKRSILLHRNNNPQGREIRRHNYDHHNRVRPVTINDYEGIGEDSFEQSSEDFDLNDIDWKRNALDRHDSHKRNLAYDHEDNQQKVQKVLLSHMTEGKISTDDFVDEKVIFSENRDSILRMNTWAVGNEQVKTINCARLTSINHRCSNGMVHMIDRMIKPVSKSIADEIRTNPELSLLNTLILSSGMGEMLSDPKQHLTMFAPTNAAINKLGHAILHKMQHGDPCLKRILRHHLLPITFCTSIIYKGGQIRNIDHDILDVNRDADDKLYINGSQVVVRDIMTTNGVVHIIDTVLMSENDQPISKALEKDGYTFFLDSLRNAGLEEYLDEQNNVTLFVPTNSAMEELGQDVLNNPSKLREILLYHIVTPEKKTCDLSNDDLLPTKLTDQKIRVNLYSHFPIDLSTAVTVQCGRLTKANRMACNGVVHEIDRVILPNRFNVLETLKSQPDFTILYRLLAETGLVDKLKQPDSSVTLFAPTDKAFYDLPKEEFRAILDNKENATKILKNHIVEESLCCAGVAPNNWFMTKRVDCLGGATIPVFRDATGQVMFGNAKVTTCDLTSSNGIIHTVDKVVISANDRGEVMESCLPDPLSSIRSATFFIRL